jgi:hypothetical protein
MLIWARSRGVWMRVILKDRPFFNSAVGLGAISAMSAKVRESEGSVIIAILSETVKLVP